MNAVITNIDNSVNAVVPQVTLSTDQHSTLFNAFKQFLAVQCDVSIGSSITIGVSAIDEQVFINCRSLVVDNTIKSSAVLPLDESPYPSNVDETGNYIMGNTECRRYRRGLWRDRLDSLAAHDGYCYLWVFHYKYRKDVATALGPYPTFWDVLSQLTTANYNILNAGMYHIVVNSTHVGSRAMHLYRGENYDGFVDLGSFHQVAIATFLDFKLRAGIIVKADQRGTAVSVQNVAILGTTVDLSVTVVDSKPVFGVSLHTVIDDDSGDVSQVSPADCKCEIHRPSLLNDELGCSVDLAIVKGAGTVAGRGNYYCHATPDVREKDLAFQVALRDYKLGLISFSAARTAVSGLRSSKAAVPQTFGVGYCYLYLVQPRYRWRVARVIGPNPSLNDVYLVSQLVGLVKNISSKLTVYNRYHCHFDLGDKISMEQLDQQVYDALTKHPGLIVI